MRYLRTVEVPIDGLQPYPGNARLHDDAALDESVEENGQYRSVVARELGEGAPPQVLAGHGTWGAFTRRGDKTIRVELIEATDREARRILLADNATSRKAGYDERLLLELVRSADADGGLAGTGYGDSDLRDLLDSAGDLLGGSGGSADQDPAPSLAERFLIPPFDVINAREGWWQDRKRRWLATGIKSEIGRGEDGGDGADTGRLTFVKGARPVEDMDEVSRKILESGSGTSIFDPVLCELAYRWFSTPGHTILDPFAGGSVRGLVAAMLGRQYIGNDLRGEQIDANREQAADFVRRGLIGGPAVDAAAITDPAVTTPVERRGAVWVKRDDLFTVPGGLGGVGGKVRSCLQLVTTETRKRRVRRLVTAGSRHSPQVVIVAAVAAHLGLECTAHVPASKEASPELAAAAALGAALVEHRPGYNTVIVARAREDADGDPAAVHVPFGMETPHAVSATRAQAQALFDDWPTGARRLVVPVGSGMTLAGILAAAPAGGPEIVGVLVGADPTERLDRYAPGGWRDRVTIVKSDLAYEHRVTDASIGGLELDPVYEAKCLPFLAADDVLWVVGRRPGKAVSPVGPPVWSAGDSAEWVDTLEPNSTDLIFTCPPYLWLEKYSDDPADLSNASEDEFERMYAKILAGSARALRDDRYVVIVVGDVRDTKGRLVDFRGMTIRAAEAAGLWLQSGAVLVTQVGSLAVRAGRSFSATRVLGRTHQDVLVFVKGSSSAAAKACGEVDVSVLQEIPASEDSEAP